MTRAQFMTFVEGVKSSRSEWQQRLIKGETLAHLATEANVGVSTLCEAFDLAGVEYKTKRVNAAEGGLTTAKIHALASQIRFMANYIEKNGQPVGEVEEFTAAFPREVV